NGATLVDVAGILAQETPHGLVGKELFFDHLHPTVAAHVAIARALAPALGAPADGYAWPAPEPLLASHPNSRKAAVVASVIVEMMLGRYDAALQEVAEV